MITLDIYFNKLVGNGITITAKQPFSNSRMLVANFAHLAQAMNEWQQAAKAADGYKPHSKWTGGLFVTPVRFNVREHLADGLSQIECKCLRDTGIACNMKIVEICYQNKPVEFE